MNKRPSTRTIIASAFVFLASASLGLSETFSFRQGVDGYLGNTSTYTEYQPLEAQAYNYGGLYRMLVFSPNGEGAPKKVGFMRFDLSSITGPVSVDEVTLTLTVAGNPERTNPDYSQTLQIFPILREGLDFGESSGEIEAGTVAFLAASYDEVNPVGWGSSNTGTYGPVAGEDYSLTSMGSYTLSSANAEESFITIHLNPSVVAGWINNPATNLGFVLVFDQSSWDQAIIYTHNEAGLIYRPELTLTVSPVPEPGAVALLGLGLVALGLRRKCQHMI